MHGYILNLFDCGWRLLYFLVIWWCTVGCRSADTYYYCVLVFV